jgi:hypothetical protein
VGDDGVTKVRIGAGHEHGGLRLYGWALSAIHPSLWPATEVQGWILMASIVVVTHARTLSMRH